MARQPARCCDALVDRRGIPPRAQALEVRSNAFGSGLGHAARRVAPHEAAHMSHRARHKTGCAANAATGARNHHRRMA